MAITTVPRFHPYPFPGYAGGSPTSAVLNSTDDWIAYIFFWPGGDLTAVRAHFTAASGSPSVNAQLFNVDATSASPVNTASAIGSAISGSPSANASTTFSGIGQSSLAAGFYAIRFIFVSGTSTTLLAGRAMMPGSQHPCQITVTDGGSQTITGPTSPHIGLGDGSTWVPINGFMPPVAIATTAFQDTSNPDEHGLWFKWPVSVRLWGVALYNGSNSRPDIRLAYYTGAAGSPSKTDLNTFDRDLAQNTTGNWNYYGIATADKPTIPADTFVGLGIRAASSHNYSIAYYDFGSGNEAVMDAFWGQNFQKFTREADTGALTVTQYQTPFLVPIFDGVDTAGGGGTVVGSLFNSRVFG